MKRHVKPLAGTLLTGAVVLVLGACSSSGSSSGASPASTGTGAGTSGGTITIASGTAPLSADQGLDFTTQGTELYSVVNTPLLTFSVAWRGSPERRSCPGLAHSLPTVSNGGKTYTFQLRSGLHYSDGTPIKASDITYALERDIKIPWQAASFVSAYIGGGGGGRQGQGEDDLGDHARTMPRQANREPGDPVRAESSTSSRWRAPRRYRRTRRRRTWPARAPSATARTSGARSPLARATP